MGILDARPVRTTVESNVQIYLDEDSRNFARSYQELVSVLIYMKNTARRDKILCGLVGPIAFCDDDGTLGS